MSGVRATDATVTGVGVEEELRIFPASPSASSVIRSAADYNEWSVRGTVLELQYCLMLGFLVVIKRITLLRTFDSHPLHKRTPRVPLQCG